MNCAAWGATGAVIQAGLNRTVHRLGPKSLMRNTLAAAPNLMSLQFYRFRVNDLSGIVPACRLKCIRYANIDGFLFQQNQRDNVSFLVLGGVAGSTRRPCMADRKRSAARCIRDDGQRYRSSMPIQGMTCGAKEYRRIIIAKLPDHEAAKTCIASVARLDTYRYRVVVGPKRVSV